MQVSAKRLSKRKKASDWGSAVIHEIIDETLREPGFQREPKAIVANWRNKPKFTVEAALNAIISGALTVRYIVKGTDLARNIWRWLNEGTKPHKIRAKNAPTLVFQWGGPGSYNPKTKPGGATLQYGGPGTVSGGETHRPVEVDHPGNEAREFYVYLGGELLPTWRGNIRTAISRAMGNVSRGKEYPPIGASEKVVRSK